MALKNQKVENLAKKVTGEGPHGSESSDESGPTNPKLSKKMEKEQKKVSPSPSVRLFNDAFSMPEVSEHILS